MSNVLISMLGTVEYREIEYSVGEKSVRTKFAQEAILQIYCNGWSRENNDRVIVLITKEAKEKYVMPQGLQEVLGNYDIEVIPLDITRGDNTEELLKTFDIILNNLRDGDEVVLDITNSLRHLPYQILTALQYAQITQQVKIRNIYYGAIQGDFKTSEGGLLLDLDIYLALQAWTQAIYMFLKTGNSSNMSELLRSSIGVRSNEENKKFKSVVESIQEFTDCILTCKGANLPNQKKTRGKSIQKAAEKLTGKIKELEASEECKNNMLIKNLMPLFKQIEERIDKEFNEKDHLEVGLATIKWCIEYGLVQQGFTALDETIKTYLCKRLNLNDIDYEDREEKAAKIQNIVEREISEEKWKINNEYRLYIKAAVEHLKDSDLKNLSSIRARRNNMNHFGFGKDNTSCEKLKEALKKDFQTFEEIIKKEGTEGVTLVVEKPSTCKMLLIFSHTMTQDQEKHARDSLGVNEFVSLPEEIQEQWSNYLYETDLHSQLINIKAFIEKTINPNDYVWVQGEFGLTYQLVSWCFKRGYIPIYATTKREYSFIEREDGAIENRNIFRHISFNKYS